MILPPLPASFADPGEQPHRVATGFGFTEGPAWRDEGGYLVFSDIQATRCTVWTPQAASASIADRAGRATAPVDAAGRRLPASTRRAASSRVGDELVVLADSFEGRELNSPNDVVVASSVAGLHRPDLRPP